MADVMKWLQDVRGLDEGLLSAMGVRRVDHPELGPAAAFPYRHDGQEYAAKFYTIDKRFRSSKGVRRGLYNADDLGRLHDLPVVICASELDALSVMQTGWKRAVSLPNGWTARGNTTEALIEAEEKLRASPFVVVAAAAHEPGESLSRAVANLLKGHDVRHASWPQGCKGANDVLMRHGEDELTRCLQTARSIDPAGGFITGFSDLPPMSERRVLRPDLYPFNKVVAFELGALSVFTGIPGSGKSTFLTWVAHRIALAEDIRVGMFAFETPAHTLRNQLSITRTGTNFVDLTEDGRKDLLATLDYHFRLVHRTFDDGSAHRLGWLEEMIETLAIRDGCKLIVIDPWNELEHLPAPGETMTSYINWATQRLRQIAERLEVHVALVAHPKKMAEGNRAPNGYDIADSAAFFNKPSLGVTVHQRQSQNGEESVELSVWKVRDVQLYGFGKHAVDVSFDTVTMQYAQR